ncbi:hypothetical protein ACFC0D_04815 [Streptomyces sp. NPDC056222]|uniref:hypothetical protein n=1 Tax=Streptomyces sp. NPDC056222 TaxID=3345749 RepID=UPI0035D6CD51
MNALHQYLLDSYRAEQRGERMPPMPGTHDIATLRAVCDSRRFDAVVAGRPARGRLRTALNRLLHPRAC